MENQVVNKIQIEGTERAIDLFHSISQRLNKKSSDKITQISRSLWKTNWKATIDWNYKNLKCKWAVVEKTGTDFIIILSGWDPANGVQDKIFNSLKKIDPDVIIRNDFHNTDLEFIGTRILYKEYKIEHKIDREDIKDNIIVDKDDKKYDSMLNELRKANLYFAEMELQEYQHYEGNPKDYEK